MIIIYPEPNPINGNVFFIKIKTETKNSVIKAVKQ